MLLLFIFNCVNAKIWNLFVDEAGKTSEQAQEIELSYEKAEPCLCKFLIILKIKKKILNFIKNFKKTSEAGIISQIQSARRQQ